MTPDPATFVEALDVYDPRTFARPLALAANVLRPHAPALLLCADAIAAPPAGDPPPAERRHLVRLGEMYAAAAAFVAATEAFLALDWPETPKREPNA